MTKPVITDTTFVSQWPLGPSFCEGGKNLESKSIQTTVIPRTKIKLLK